MAAAGRAARVVEAPGGFRAGEIGVIIAFVAFGASMFALGRNMAPQNDCCDRLGVRDSELLLCETRLQAAGLPSLPSL